MKISQKYQKLPIVFFISNIIEIKLLQAIGKIMPTCRAVIKQSSENIETKAAKKKGKKGKK